MREVTATEAARRFSELLDAIEHGGDDYVVVRHGRRVARLVPVSFANGESVAELLRASPPDASWSDDVRELRSLLIAEERTWNA